MNKLILTGFSLALATSYASATDVPPVEGGSSGHPHTVTLEKAKEGDHVAYTLDVDKERLKERLDHAEEKIEKETKRVTDDVVDASKKVEKEAVWVGKKVERWGKKLGKKF